MPNKTIEDFAYQVRDYMRSAEVVPGKNIAYSQENNAVIASIENGKSYKVKWTGSATVTLKKNSASGTEITSGSTSPLSFTADADYDLYFGSSADVTEIMVYDGASTDDTYEPYYVPLKISMFPRSEQSYLGAKNICPRETRSFTINGIVWTPQEDGTVKANGTATALSIYWIASNNTDLLYYDKDVLVNGAPQGSSHTTYCIGGYGIGELYSGDKLFKAGTGFSIALVVFAGVTVNNLIFKPMVRLATDPDDTYAPNSFTNRKLMLEKLSIGAAQTTVSADNLVISGYYWLDGNTIGITGVTTGWLLVLNSDDTTNNNITQVFYPVSDGSKFYMRRKYNGTWAAWYVFTGTVVS